MFSRFELYDLFMPPSERSSMMSSGHSIRSRTGFYLLTIRRPPNVSPWNPARLVNFMVCTRRRWKFYEMEYSSWQSVCLAAGQVARAVSIWKVSIFAKPLVSTCHSNKQRATAYLVGQHSSNSVWPGSDFHWSMMNSSLGRSADVMAARGAEQYRWATYRPRPTSGRGATCG